MKFLENILNRILTHWQSTLFGLSYIAIFIMLYLKTITVAQALELMAAILGVKGIFLNKDPDKTQTKTEVKENEINIERPNKP
jgi:hypothetical protein